MHKETASLLVCVGLAVTGVTLSFQWMNAHHRSDSEQMLRKAEPLIQQLNQTEQKSLHLAQISPPQGLEDPWRLELKTSTSPQHPTEKKISILVYESGPDKPVD